MASKPTTSYRRFYDVNGWLFVSIALGLIGVGRLAVHEGSFDWWFVGERARPWSRLGATAAGKAPAVCWSKTIASRNEPSILPSETSSAKATDASGRTTATTETSVTLVGSAKDLRCLAAARVSRRFGSERQTAYRQSWACQRHRY